MVNPLKKLFFYRNYSTKAHANWWRKRKLDWNKDYFSTHTHPHRKALMYVLGQIKWSNLLEVGCGGGANLINITRYFPKTYLAGNDVNKEAIEFCKEVFAKHNPSLYFTQSPADDMLIGDKNTEVILSDMVYIYVSNRDIGKHLDEIKRVARDYVVLCEFHHKSWWKRMKLKLFAGYSAFNWQKLLTRHGFTDIISYRITPQDWPESKLQQEFAHIFLAKIPK